MRMYLPYASVFYIKHHLCRVNYFTYYKKLRLLSYRRYKIKNFIELLGIHLCLLVFHKQFS